MIYYAGDIHGEVEAVIGVNNAARNNNIKYIIQVGDFGIRWPGRPCPIYKYFKKQNYLGNNSPIWITCGGNHDNWDKWFSLAEKQSQPNLVELAPNCFYAQRGVYLKIEDIGHLFLGGAESVDKHHRTEGKSWWASETPSYEEFSKFFTNLENHKPEVVVTHDAPLFLPIAGYQRNNSPTPRNLENIIKLSSHKPTYHVYGHHHLLQEDLIDGITYKCCGLGGQYITLE